MELKQKWIPFIALVAAVGLAGLSCGKTDSEQSSRAPGASETARSTAPAPGAPDTAASPAMASKQASGEVVSADAALKTLVVKSGGGEMSFDVKESATGDLAGIKPGDQVTVKYTEVAGKYTAETITRG